MPKAYLTSHVESLVDVLKNIVESDSRPCDQCAVPLFLHDNCFSRRMHIAHTYTSVSVVKWQKKVEVSLYTPGKILLKVFLANGRNIRPASRKASVFSYSTCSPVFYISSRHVLCHYFFQTLRYFSVLDMLFYFISCL